MMISRRRNRPCIRFSLLLSGLTMIAGCGSPFVEGRLNYPDGITSTAGDSVQVRLYGSSTRGATILNVGENNEWRYPPKEDKDLREWPERLPKLDKKGKEVPVFVFQAIKRESNTIISTQMEMVKYPEFKKLKPDSVRSIRLIYEPVIPDTTNNDENDDIELPPK